MSAASDSDASESVSPASSEPEDDDERSASASEADEEADGADEHGGGEEGGEEGGATATGDVDGEVGSGGEGSASDEEDSPQLSPAAAAAAERRRFREEPWGRDGESDTDSDDFEPRPAYTGTDERQGTVPYVEHIAWEPPEPAPPRAWPSEELDRAQFEREGSPHFLRTRVVFNRNDRVQGFERLMTTGALQFSSHFESGNLLSAERVWLQHKEFTDASKFVHHVYDLSLSEDVHTQGHTQWFYFSVDNIPLQNAGAYNVQFNIRYSAVYP